MEVLRAECMVKIRCSAVDVGEEVEDGMRFVLDERER
jgi:hypothetical protein